MVLKINPSRMSAGRPLTPIVVALFLAMAMAAACSAAPGAGTPSPEAGTPAPGAPTPTDAPDKGNEPSGPSLGGPSGAPITVTVGGSTYGYVQGSCAVDPSEVSVNAADESGISGVVIDWRADDPGEATATIVVPDPAALLNLTAGPSNPATLPLQVVVAGSQAEVTANMLETLTNELMGVVIRIDCDEQRFGSSDQPEVTGRVTVDVGGETYVLDALDDCRFNEDGVHVSKLASDDGISFTVTPDPGPGHTVQLIADGGGWVRGPGFISDQPGVEFEVSGLSATWSGPLTPQFGDEQPATISIECG